MDDMAAMKKLAEEALADDAKLPIAPWWIAEFDGGICGGEEQDPVPVGDTDLVDGVEEWMLSARTREPALARAFLSLAAERDRTQTTIARCLKYLGSLTPHEREPDVCAYLREEIRHDA